MGAEYTTTAPQATGLSFCEGTKIRRGGSPILGPRSVRILVRFYRTIGLPESETPEIGEGGPSRRIFDPAEKELAVVWGAGGGGFRRTKGSWGIADCQGPQFAPVPCGRKRTGKGTSRDEVMGSWVLGWHLEAITLVTLKVSRTMATLDQLFVMRSRINMI